MKKEIGMKMTVKALKPHTNLMGVHAVGDVYVHPQPAGDLAFELVEEVTASAAGAAAKPKPSAAKPA